MTDPKIEHGTSYVPALVICRVAQSSGPIISPISEDLETAVLFADISGFTALTEGLAARGAVGMEELSQVISDYFGCLAEVIVDHGGDIVKFAGDAMLALWPASSDNTLAQATHRAAQCALAVQAAMREFSERATARLELKVALGAGSATCMHVGGMFGRWELLIAGQPFLQVGRAGDHAKPGDVVVAEEALALLGEVDHNPPLEDGTVHITALADQFEPVALEIPTLTPDLSDQLLPYIPAAIRDQLGAGQSGWHAELRRISVIFVNLPDVTHTTPIEQAQRLMHELQTAIYRYEGSVNKLSVDDKGVTLIAVMGLPPFAHEDDPARALQAARALHDCLENMDLTTAIGVTTGRAYCGSVGSPRRCEYTIMGDMVNLAARLMQAAPHSILCDSATYEAAPNGIEFETLEPMMVKGKAEPIQAYRPLEQTQGVAVRKRSVHAIVGRQAELATLEAQLKALARGEPTGVVVVEGEAGIGKSRLIEELEDIAHAQGIHTEHGEADSIERSTPYHAWRGILSRQLSLDEVNDPQERRDHVLALLSALPELHRLAPLLNMALPLDLPENDVTAQMSGELRAENAHHLFLEILQMTVGAAPLVLILDDAHWKDSASWSFTRQVAREMGSVLLVLSTRPIPQPLPQEYGQMLALPGTVKLMLNPLGPEAALALANQRLGIDDLPQSVAKMIIDKAGGNPYFTEQVTYALRDAGHIVVTDGQCRLAPGVDIDSISMPDTVEGVVSERIDRLTPEQQLSLKVASVIGRTFLGRLLRNIHPLETDWAEVVGHLDALQSAELADMESVVPEPVYIFKSIIAQQVAYNLMLFAQRRELHRAIAEWHEEEFASDLAPLYPTLAHHYTMAEENVKAIEYLEKSGLRAVDNFANEEAVIFFNQALALHEKSPDLISAARRARWHEQLGEAYYALGKHGESLENLNEALTLMGNKPPGPVWRHLTSLLRAVVVQTMHRLFPRAFKRQIGDAGQILIAEARANERLAQIYYMDNAKVQSMNAALSALNFAEGADTSAELARSYANVSVTTALVTAYSLSAMYERFALETGAAVGHVPSLAYAYEVVGLYHTGAGHWVEADERLVESIALADSIGDRRRWDEATFLRAVAFLHHGRLAEAKALYDELYAVGRELDILQVQLWGLTGRISLGLLRGGDNEALKALDQLLREHADRAGAVSRADALLAFGVVAQAHARAGDLREARQAAARVVGFISESETISVYLQSGYHGLGEALTSLFSIDKAEGSTAERKMLETAISTFKSFAMMYPTARPMTYLWRGVYARLRGQDAKARRYFTKSLTWASRLDLPLDHAFAHRELARLEAAGSTAASDHANEARRLFTACGADLEIERLDTELNGAP